MYMRALIPVLILAASAVSQSTGDAPTGQKTHDPKATAIETDFYPLLVRSELPLYPGPARYMHISGSVVIEVTVEKGSVTNAQVKSSDSKILSDWAVANVKTWQFLQYEHAAFPITYVYRLDRKSHPDDRENLKVEFEFPHIVRISASPLHGSCNDCGTNR